MLLLRRTQPSCWKIVLSAGILASSSSSSSSSTTQQQHHHHHHHRLSLGAVTLVSAMSTATPPRPGSISSSSARPSRSTSRIAVGQLCSTSNKYMNLVHVAECAGSAKRQGACMLFLPENVGFLGSSGTGTLHNAEPPIILQHDEDDETPSSTSTKRSNIRNSKEVTESLREIVTQSIQGQKPADSTLLNPSSSSHPILILDGLQTIAVASQLWLTGTIHVKAGGDNDNRVYNTHVVLDDHGHVRAKYEKIHLFDVDIPGQVTIQESATTAPGTSVVVCDSPIGRLGLSVCYDVRFPELYTELVQQRGSQILLVPSAFTVPTGKAHWHTLLQARAIETQCYVVAAAQVGIHNTKRTSYGHSLVIDPWGTIVVDAGGIHQTEDEREDGSSSTPTVVCCDIDLSLIVSIRQRMPIQQHRQMSHFT